MFKKGLLTFGILTLLFCAAGMICAQDAQAPASAPMDGNSANGGCCAMAVNDNACAPCAPACAPVCAPCAPCCAPSHCCWGHKCFRCCFHRGWRMGGYYGGGCASMTCGCAVPYAPCSPCAPACAPCAPACAPCGC